MHVFVAGATGALGRPLVRVLLASGHAVTGLTRTHEKGSWLREVGATPAVADARDADALRDVVVAAAPDVVVHALTALPPGGPRRARDLGPTNLLRTQGTDNLLAAARAAGVRRVVAESIALVYGPQVAPATEETPRVSSDPSGLLGEALAAAAHLEDAVLACDGVVLRFGFFYGPDAGTADLAGALRRRRVPVPGVTGGLLPWIHTADAAAATALACEQARSGEVYNVVADEHLGLEAFVRAVAVAAGAPEPITLPRWIVRLAAPYLAAVAGLHLPVSNAKARRELGWSPAHARVRDGWAARGEQHAR